jgi:hypothetical protein
MKKKLLFTALLLSGAFIANCQTGETSGGWAKYENNPIIGGGKLGTLYDVNVLKNGDGNWWMYFSWFDGNGVGFCESKDGLNWTKPVVCISYKDGWNYNRMETDYVTRPVVLKKDGIYRMWYTRQAPFRSWVGYAESPDGKNWERKNDKDVLLPTENWEKDAVLCSQVIWDEQEQIFKMWYSGGRKLGTRRHWLCN